MRTRPASTYAFAVLLGLMGITNACSDGPGSPGAPSSGDTPAVSVASTTLTQRSFDGPIELIDFPDVIVVEGTRILLDKDSIIRNGTVRLAFGDLRIGATTHVATLFDGRRNRATQVDVLDPVDLSNVLRFSGTVGSVTGSCPLLAFTATGVLVLASETTLFIGNPCTAVSPGATVEVSGTRNGNAIQARQVTVH